MKQFFLRATLWLLPIVLITLSACGSSDEPPPEVTPVALRFFSLNTDSAGEAAALDQFEANNPAITIEREQYQQLPTQYLLESPPPDLMLIGPTYMLLAAIEQNLVLDVTDIWAQSGLLDSYPPALQALSEVDGKQYYVPTGYSWSGIYYNKESFAQYDLDVPQSWDDLLFAADTLLANGVIPFSLAGDDAGISSLWFDYLNLRMNGPDFHSRLMRGQESYLDDRVYAVFQQWQFLLENGYFVEAPVTINDLESMAAIISDEKGLLTNQKAAMVLADPFALGALPENWQVQPGFFRFPTMDPSLPVGEVALSLGFMIPTQADNTLQAIELLTYLSQADVQEIMYRPSELANFAPASGGIGRDGYSPELLARASVVAEADSVDMPIFWGSPSNLQLALAGALDSFLRGVEKNEVSIDQVLAGLEEARLAAQQGGLFFE